MIINIRIILIIFIVLVISNFIFWVNNPFSARGFGYDGSFLILINFQSKCIKIKLHTVQ